MRAKRKKVRSDTAKALIGRLLNRTYGAEHPRALVRVKRQNSVSIRIRIIDPDFEGIDRFERDKVIWPVLRQLPESVFSQITMLLLLTPEESKSSLANFEFEHPLPSRL